MKIKINIKAKSIEVEGKFNRTELNKVLTGLSLKDLKSYHINSVIKIDSWNDPIVYDENVPLKIGEFTSIYNIEA